MLTIGHRTLYTFDPDDLERQTKVSMSTTKRRHVQADRDQQYISSNHYMQYSSQTVGLEIHSHLAMIIL